jgi:hypothetical protein
MMTRKIGMALGLGLAVILSAQSALAFGPVNKLAPGAAANAPVEASFFGRPYPYG